MSKFKTCSIRDEPYPHREAGQDVIDATESIYWTQEPRDRKGAVQMHENHCQIAEAIKRCHPEISQVWVKASRIAARYEDGTYVKWEMSNRLKKHLRSFDEGGRIPDGDYRALPIGNGHRKEDLVIQHERVKESRKARGVTGAGPYKTERKVLTTR